MPTLPAEVSDLDYEAWNQALIERFFNPGLAGVPVYLSVDDGVLITIAGEHGWPADTAVSDFEKAVQSKVYGRDPFGLMLDLSRRWRRAGAQGYPPFVAVLAATVLAASRMGPGDRVGPGSHSYYRPLRRILGMPDEGMPSGYDEAVPSLWRYLNDWLQGNDGRMGAATARTRQAVENIGWSLSQTVLRGSDRARLAVFFRAIGVHPNEDIDGHELLLRLREWCKVADRDSRLSQAAFNRQMEALLADALQLELLRFDDVVYDDDGRYCIPMALTTDNGGSPFGLAADVPARANLGAHQIEKLGFSLVAGQWNRLPDGWPCGPGVAVDRAVGPIRLLFPRRDCYLFRINDFLGSWTSVDAAEIGVEHRVIVRADRAEAARAVMAASDGEGTLARRAQLPPGWVAFARYVPLRSPSAPSDLAILTPRNGQFATLSGGLRVASRERLYLTGCAPDLIIPAGGASTLEIDGTDYPVETSAETVVRLSDLPLAEGSHMIKAGPRRISFSLVDHLRETTIEPSIGLPIYGDDDKRWICPVPKPIDDDAQASGSWLSGAALDGCFRAEVYRILLRTSGDVYVLGSAASRQCARIFPASPAWLREIGLPATDFDLEPALDGIPFNVEWTVAVLASHRRVRRVAGVVHGSGPAPRQPPQIAPSALWYRLVGEQGKPFRFPAGDADAQLWQRYVDGES